MTDPLSRAFAALRRRATTTRPVPTPEEEAPIVYVFASHPEVVARYLAAARDAYRRDTGYDGEVPAAGITPSTVLAGVNFRTPTRVYLPGGGETESGHAEAVRYAIAFERLLNDPNVALFHLPDVPDVPEVAP